MKNPNKYIRAAYLAALTGIGCPIWDKRVPNDTDIPALYVLISTQTKSETNRTQCDKNWNCSIAIDIYNRGPRGYASTVLIDDTEELITDAISPGVAFDIDLSAYGLKVYNTFTDAPVDLPQEMPNETILHRVLRFRHIVGEV